MRLLALVILALAKYLLHVLATRFNGRGDKNEVTKAVIGLLQSRERRAPSLCYSASQRWRVLVLEASTAISEGNSTVGRGGLPGAGRLALSHRAFLRHRGPLEP
jgi:hypothetical protein